MRRLNNQSLVNSKDSNNHFLLSSSPISDFDLLNLTSLSSLVSILSYNGITENG